MVRNMIASGRCLSTAVVLVLVALTLAAPHGAHAQEGGGQAWVPLDASPPGTPADVVPVAAATGPAQTVLDVTIHGFWVTPRSGPDGTAFTQIFVPGLQRLALLGAPEIPVVRVPIAVVTDAPGVSLVSVEPLGPPATFTMHLWPQPVPAQEDSSGTAEVFMQDPNIYALGQLYPLASGDAGSITGAMGSLRASLLECYPIRWVPSRDSLVVQSASRWTFAHDGALPAIAAITRDRNRIASQEYLNWASVSTVIPVDIADYQGEFLFVYPSAWASALKPLMSQKSIRGYTVAQITLESLGSVSCTSVRNAILGWYSATPSSHDHYCILVGDIDSIPFCPPPGSSDPLTDDLYGSADPNNPERDIFVGRLPAESGSDLQNQVQKILDYENHPSSTKYYGDVLLVAHKPDGSIPDGDYEAQQDSVRLASYTVHPDFFTYYGSVPGHTNAGLTALINSGMGITSYRGHGGPDDWWTWDNTGSCPGYPSYVGECFTNTDVNALSNGALTTLVWSIACDNSDLRDAACIGRAWMAKYPGGAAAHYGSSRPSSTQDNDVLEDSLFAAVWRYGLTKLGHATTWAEDRSIGWDFGFAVSNAWSYGLFGDPDMDVRRDVSPLWTIASPAYVLLSASGGAPLDMGVLDAQGMPVPNVLVSLWKPAAGAVPASERGRGGAAGVREGGTGASHASGGSGVSGVPAGALGAGDEIATNLYTGTDGYAHFTVDPATTGEIYFAVRDSVGHAQTDSIPVVSSAGVDRAATGTLTLVAAPSVTSGTTWFRFGRPLDAPAAVRIYDVLGRPVATIDVARGASEVLWSGLDRAGRLVHSGLYFAKLTARDGRTARVAIVR